MRRASLAFAGVLSLVSSPNFLYADLPSPYELVEGLRSNNQVELAIELLNELKAKPDRLSEEDRKTLSLEFATTKLEQASQEVEDGKRNVLLGQARVEFENFIKANPNHPKATKANVQIARLLSLNAKGIYSKSRRAETASDRRLEASKARRPFMDAHARYTQAIKGIADRLGTLDQKTPLYSELDRERKQAELDQMVILYDVAATFDLEEERKERGDAMEKARKAFEGVAGKYEKQRVGYLAQVWAWQCQYENGEQAVAAKSIDTFCSTNGTLRDAADAVRLGRFFGIQHTFEKGQYDTALKESVVQQYQRTEQAAQRWLQTYPESKNTPEGFGARYRLALMKERQGKLPGNLVYDEKADKVKSLSGLGRQKLQEANRIYKDISESDNEYTDRSIRARLRNLIVLLEADGGSDDPPLKSINTLEQGYLAAQVQQGRINMLNEKLRNPPKAEGKKEAPAPLDPETVKKEEARRTKLMVNYLERGLQMSTSKDTARDLFDAQLMLCNVLTKVDRAAEAAILGEAMARNNPKMGKASVAALLGVYAYNTGIGKLKERGGDDKANVSDIGRLKNLAVFASNTWPSESSTDAVRHVHAFFLNKEKDYAGAWEVYNKISTGYSELYHARREQAVTMFNLVKPEERDPKKYSEAVKKNITEKSKEWKGTLDALEALPEPGGNVAADDGEAYINARIQLAQLYLMAGDTTKVENTTKSVVKTVETLKQIEEKKRFDLACIARSLAYAAITSRAEEARRGKDFAQASQLLDPQIKTLQDEIAKKDKVESTPGFEMMRKRQRDMITVAMTVSVQDKKIDRANELLELLQKSGGDLEQNIAIMRSLVSSIKGQIDTLKADKNETEAQALSVSFTEFLDKLGGDVAKASNSLITFLGQGYSAVDQHQKAADLYQSVLDRTFTPPEKKTEDEVKELQEADTKFKRQTKFLQAQAYRMAGTPESFKKAVAAMMEILGGDPLKAVAKDKRGWGYSSLPVRKEYCSLLEDQKIWGGAVQNWNRLTKEFVGDLPAIPKPGDPQGQKKSGQRQLYFDLYFETYRCSLKAYAGQDPMKFKGGQTAIDDKIADIGGKLGEVIGRNKDINADTVEKIKYLIEANPKAKKKFNELLTATANAVSANELKTDPKTDPK